MSLRRDQRRPTRATSRQRWRAFIVANPARREPEIWPGLSAPVLKGGASDYAK